MLKEILAVVSSTRLRYVLLCNTVYANREILSHLAVIDLGVIRSLGLAKEM